eukprot:2361432-Pleurochrysis_carterae.AAC.1
MDRRGAGAPCVGAARLHSFFQVLDGTSGVASLDTLLSRFRYLLQSLATKLQLTGATTFKEYSVWKGNLVISTTRPATSKAHDYSVRKERQRALWITLPPCASGYRLKNAKEPRIDA